MDLDRFQFVVTHASSMEMQPVHSHLPTSSISTLWPIVLWIDLQTRPNRCSHIIVCPHLQFTKSYQLYYGFDSKRRQPPVLWGLKNNKQTFTWLTYCLIDRGAPRLKQRLDVPYSCLCFTQASWLLSRPSSYSLSSSRIITCACLHCIALQQEKMPPPLDAHGIWLHNVKDMDLQ
jgi:hypothetical protein